jgi:hypothetical protein
MTISTWDQFTMNEGYNIGSNWSAGVPGGADTAVFAASDRTNISLVSADDQVAGWLFNPGATQYNFNITFGHVLEFLGSGIVINAGPCTYSTLALSYSTTVAPPAEP